MPELFPVSSLELERPAVECRIHSEPAQIHHIDNREQIGRNGSRTRRDAELDEILTGRKAEIICAVDRKCNAARS